MGQVGPTKCWRPSRALVVEPLLPTGFPGTLRERTTPPPEKRSRRHSLSEDVPPGVSWAGKLRSLVTQNASRVKDHNPQASAETNNSRCFFFLKTLICPVQIKSYKSIISCVPGCVSLIKGKQRGKAIWSFYYLFL